MNRPNDVKVIQERLRELKLLSEENHEEESCRVEEFLLAGSIDGSMPEASIPQTIAGIRLFQSSIFSGWSDGRIDPGKRTLEALFAPNPGQVPQLAPKNKIPEKAKQENTLEPPSKKLDQAALALGLLRRRASFVWGTDIYYSLDELGLGADLAKCCAGSANGIALAVFDLLQLDDGSQVAFHLMSRLSDEAVSKLDTKLSKRLQEELDVPWADEADRQQRQRLLPKESPKKKATSPAKSGKTDNRPARPSDPEGQMSSLLSVARSDAGGKTPAHGCYAAVKRHIAKAGGYGDILNIYTDKRFSGKRFQESAVNFADAVEENGASELGLEVLTGLPVQASPGTLLVIKGDGRQKISQEHGDINVIDRVVNGLLICYNDGKMALPGDVASWSKGGRYDIVVGMYKPLPRP